MSYDAFIVKKLKGLNRHLLFLFLKMGVQQLLLLYPIKHKALL